MAEKTWEYWRGGGIVFLEITCFEMRSDVIVCLVSEQEVTPHAGFPPLFPLVAPLSRGQGALLGGPLPLPGKRQPYFPIILLLKPTAFQVCFVFFFKKNPTYQEIVRCMSM